jgi:hypothetical protein
MTERADSNPSFDLASYDSFRSRGHCGGNTSLYPSTTHRRLSCQLAARAKMLALSINHAAGPPVFGSDDMTIWSINQRVQFTFHSLLSFGTP